jgi:hypothetical protein
MLELLELPLFDSRYAFEKSKTVLADKYLS